MCYLNSVENRKSNQNIETDSFDRELFGELEATSEELKNLIERGSHLLPNFRSLILDLNIALKTIKEIISRRGI